MSRRLARFRDAFKHAFSTRPQELTEEQVNLLARVATAVRKRGLETAAVVSLEAARPVAGVTGHSVDFLRPLLTPLAGMTDIDLGEVAKLLRNPAAIDRLSEAITTPPDDQSAASDNVVDSSIDFHQES